MQEHIPHSYLKESLPLLVPHQSSLRPRQDLICPDTTYEYSSRLDQENILEGDGVYEFCPPPIYHRGIVCSHTRLSRWASWELLAEQRAIIVFVVQLYPWASQTPDVFDGGQWWL